MSMSESTFWILSALAGGRRHGYGIMVDVAAASDGDITLKVPTLYATLERMQQDGLIGQDGVEIVDGRTRRYFVLTDDGARALHMETARLQARVRVATARLAARPGLASAAFG